MTIEAIDAVGAPKPRGGTLRETGLEQRLHYLDIDCHILTRRMLRPGLTAAYLVVAPSGVWVLGSRRHEGRPAPQGGILSRRTQILQLGNRSAHRLVNGIVRQTEAVHETLDSDVPVSGMLCVLDADWPIFGGAFTVDGVRVLWPKKACEVIETGRRLGIGQMNDVHEQLSTAFPAAPKRHAVTPRVS